MTQHQQFLLPHQFKQKHLPVSQWTFTVTVTDTRNQPNQRVTGAKQPRGPDENWSLTSKRCSLAFIAGFQIPAAETTSVPWRCSINKIKTVVRARYIWAEVKSTCVRRVFRFGRTAPLTSKPSRGRRQTWRQTRFCFLSAQRVNGEINKGFNEWVLNWHQLLFHLHLHRTVACSGLHCLKADSPKWLTASRVSPTCAHGLFFLLWQQTCDVASSESSSVFFSIQ